jgi:hypothetical protein
MTDDVKDRGARDRSRIALDEDYEVRYWCERLGCTPDELRIAVREVGNSVEAVRDYLKKK